jgi:Fe-S-cluster-containing hydrogenase component 2
MQWGAFSNRDEFVRHVRNMASLGLILYVFGILTGYVPNWLCVMIAIGSFTLQFPDYFFGRTKGAGYFWVYLSIQGFSNFFPFQFPLNQERWKVDTNDLIAWQFGGKGFELFPGIGIMLALPVVVYITYIAIRLLRTPPNAESKAVKTVQTKRWRIWCQSIMFGWYMVLFATGMTARPVTNPELFFWFLAMLFGSLVFPFFIGRWFCGWMCPVGTLQDSIMRFYNFKGITISDKFKAQINRIYVPAAMVAMIIVIYTFERVFQLASSAEMMRDPDWTSLWKPMVWTKVLTNGMFLGSLLFAYRIYCRYFCWYIGYRVVLGQPALYRVPFQTDRCRICPDCEPEKRCVMGFQFQSVPEGEEELSIRSIGEVPVNCNLCYECRDACPHGVFKKKIKRINVIPERCIGCRLCELACSGGRLGVFDISRSNIQIEMEGTPEIPVPKLKDTCDACGGDPRCIKVCPARVIIWDKDGVRKGMEAPRPGAVKRFFRKMNPFSKTPQPCTTLCGAYPAACPTCDLNTARQTEVVQGETA